MSLFKDGTKTLLKIDLKNWLMTEAGTGCMQRLMSPVQCLYIRFGHTEWINKTSPLWLSPYPVTVLSLFLLRPEPSSEKERHTLPSAVKHTTCTLSPPLPAPELVHVIDERGGGRGHESSYTSSCCCIVLPQLCLRC